MATPDFFKMSLENAHAAEAHIAELGGLPEITRASEDLMAVMAQTGQEIAEAQFAPRFRRTLDPNMREFAGIDRSPLLAHVVDAEGEAGLKRAELRSRLQTIESDLKSALYQLVELRAEVQISQIPYEGET